MLYIYLGDFGGHPARPSRAGDRKELDYRMQTEKERLEGLHERISATMVRL
ncbi:MAG: hypothetical protein QUS33_10270 [Dehalococcoidia bacterium]|nr:hypothetical protein [Dehalococcoidia bacterium]